MIAACIVPIVLCTSSIFVRLKLLQLPMLTQCRGKQNSANTFDSKGNHRVKPENTNKTSDFIYKMRIGNLENNQIKG